MEDEEENSMFGIIGEANINGRIYSEEVFSKAIEEYKEKILIEQRDENIDAILEDRKPNLISCPISVRRYLGDDDQYQITNYDIVMDNPVSISSRSKED